MDLATHRFSATVDGTVVAQDYAFAVNTATVGRMVLWDTSGSLKVENLSVGGALAQSDPTCSAQPYVVDDAGDPDDEADADDPDDPAQAFEAGDEDEGVSGVPDTGDEQAGCACSLPSSSAAPRPWWSLAAALALGARARRRRSD